MGYMEHISGLIQQEELCEKLNLAWCKMGAQVIWTVNFNGVPGDPKDLGTLGMRNRFTCESHHELFRDYLEAYCDGRLDEGLEPYEAMIRRLQQGEY